MHAGYIYLHRRAVHRELGIDAKRKRTEAARRRKNGGAGERQHQNRKLLDQENEICQQTYNVIGAYKVSWRVTLTVVSEPGAKA